MPNDIRAISACSLGTIVGNANVDDSYVNGGAGLVKTTGSVTINGLITPAVGTLVSLSYTKGGVTRQIPRALRVLSSYADPVTRQTAVELGCKLTYLDDLRERLNWRALDDPANTLTANDAAIITIPIMAQGIAQRCLTELGLTAASLNLTNAFSIAQFDLSPGYVQVLSDLLVSESLVGYLNTSEVLQVVSLEQEGGTGPVFDLNQLIASSKIGSGQVPAETVIARYSTLRLKQPQQTEPLGWKEQTNSVAYRIDIPYKLLATEEARIATFNIPESTKIETEYQDIRTRDDKTLRLPIRRITTFTSNAAAHVGNVFSEYLANQIPFDSPQVQKTTIEVYQYDDEGNEKIYDRVVTGALAFALGSISVPIVFDDSYVVINVNEFLQLEGEHKETITINNSQQVTTWSYLPWFMTIAGQQAIAAGRDGLDSPAAVGSYLDGIISAGMRLSDYRVETIEAPSPRGAPTVADQNTAATAKDGNPSNGWRTESDARVILAMGSAAAQRRAEFAPPYVPDDRFAKVGGIYISIPSDASSKALGYARVQNRLDHANRNGMNIQALPEQMPEAPFSPIIIRSGGVSALYRTNGTAWTIGPAGVVASTDALFWGGVGGSGPRWFPVAPGITTLPAVPPVVGGQMTVTQVVPVAIETYELKLRTRIGITVQAFDYLPSETVTAPPLVVRPRLTVSEVVPESAMLRVRPLLAASEVVPESAMLRVRPRLTVSEVLPESVTLRARSLLAVSEVAPELATLRVRSLISVTEYINLADYVSLLLHMDGSNGSNTFTDSSPAARTITPYGDAQISTVQSKFGGASAYFGGSGRLESADDLAFDFGSGGFTLEFWLYIPTGAAANKGLINKGSWPSGNVSSFLIYYGGAKELSFYASNTSNTAWAISDQRFATNPATNQWHHVAVTREDNIFRGFFNGIKTFEITYASALFNNSNPIVIGSGNAGSSGITAYVDELRITSRWGTLPAVSGLARYKADFTVPTGPF